MKSQMIDNQLSARLKKVRKLAGYRSGRAFALANDIAVTTYLNHESGKRGMSIAVALRYCQLLRASFSWLVTGEGSYFGDNNYR